jgi:hypothetical protein
MILVLEKTITPEQKERLNQELRTENCIIKEIKGVEETILGLSEKSPRISVIMKHFPGYPRLFPYPNLINWSAGNSTGNLR